MQAEHGATTPSTPNFDVVSTPDFNGSLGTPNFGSFGPYSEDVASNSDDFREDCDADTDADDWASPGHATKATNSKKGALGSAEDTDAEALERAGIVSSASKVLCIAVATLSGKDLGAFEVDVHADDSLQTLRDRLVEVSGVPSRQQKLVHGAHVIESADQLKALNRDVCLVLIPRRIPFIATGSVDATIRLWDGETYTCERTLKGHADWVRSVTFSADGLKLLTASEDRTVRIWDVSTGDCVQTLQGHNQAVQCAAFSPDGALVITACDDVVARVWDTASGELQQTFTGHRKWVLTVAFSPDGLRCLTASRDGTARLWQTSSGACVQTFPHQARVACAVFSSDGRQVLTASARSARLWAAVAPGVAPEVPEGGPEDGAGQRVPIALKEFTGHDADILCAAFSHDDSWVLTGSIDTTAKLFDAKSCHCILTLNGHKHWVFSVAFSPTGLRILTGSRDNTAMVWDTASGNCLRVLQGHCHGVSSIAHSI